MQAESEGPWPLPSSVDHRLEARGRLPRHMAVGPRYTASRQDVGAPCRLTGGQGPRLPRPLPCSALLEATQERARLAEGGGVGVIPLRGEEGA